MEIITESWYRALTFAHSSLSEVGTAAPNTKKVKNGGPAPLAAMEIRMLNRQLRRKESVSSQETTLVINTFKIDKTMAAPRRWLRSS